MKKFAIVLVVIVAVIVLCLSALFALVDPNQFKPLIVGQVEKTTGLKLEIQGDLHWQWYPQLGISMGQTTLDNPEGFSESALLTMHQASIHVALLPLLHHQLDIENILLDGVQLHLETLHNGATNIDVFRHHDASQSATESTHQPQRKAASASTSSSPTGTSRWSVTVKGMAIHHGHVVVVNQQTRHTLTLTKVNLDITDFSPQHWTNVQLSGQLHQPHMSASIQGQLSLNLSSDYQPDAVKNGHIILSYRQGQTVLNRVAIVLPSLKYGQASPLSMDVKGQVEGQPLTLSAKTQLQIDQPLQVISLANLQVAATWGTQSDTTAPMVLALNGNVHYQRPSQQVSLVLNTLAVNQTKVAGHVSAKLTDPLTLTMDVHSSNLNIDQLSSQWHQFRSSHTDAPTPAQPASTAASSAGAVTAPTSSNTKLAALKGMTFKAKLTAKALQLHKIKLQQLQMMVVNQQGHLQLTQLNGKLYQGTVSATGQLDATKDSVTYHIHPQMVGVQIHPLLMAVAGKSVLEGRGNLDLDVQGNSLMESDVLKNLRGKVKVALTDGAVRGVNVAQLIRTYYAKFKGQSLTEGDTSQKTDFSSLNATLTLAHGVATTQDLTMMSPLLRLNGSGSANYLNKTLDCQVRTAIVGTLKGQGGKDITELNNVTIPVMISGAWHHPKYRLIFDDELKQKAKKELARGLKKLDKKITDEKTKAAVHQLLKGLFN